MQDAAKILSLIALFHACAFSGGRGERLAEPGPDRYDSFRPGEVWLDTEGYRIVATGGSVFLEGDTFYYYGEFYEKGKRFAGFNCYSSRDLYNWTYEGECLKVTDESEKLNWHGNHMGNPYVRKNPVGRYVLWTKIGLRKGGMGVGVCVADKPTGPFQPVKRVFGGGAGDFTMWEEDGQSYVIFNKGHRGIVIAELTEDLLDATGKQSMHMRRDGPPQGREGPAITKHEGKYYIITSGTTGYRPNPAEYAVADRIHGPYREKGNPCVGEHTETTFHSQPRNILHLPEHNTYIYIGDRWVPRDRNTTLPIWLPIEIDGEKMTLRWHDQWRLPHPSTGGADE
jgi:beta-xylosidase